ncbi:hypothetical protein WI0192307A02_CDS0076 [Pseudomonas phage KG853]
MEGGNGYLAPTDEAKVIPGRNPHRTLWLQAGASWEIN